LILEAIDQLGSGSNVTPSSISPRPTWALIEPIDRTSFDDHRRVENSIEHAIGELRRPAEDHEVRIHGGAGGLVPKAKFRHTGPTWTTTKLLTEVNEKIREDPSMAMRRSRHRVDPAVVRLAPELGQSLANEIILGRDECLLGDG
jgi:hypothetical protein